MRYTFTNHTHIIAILWLTYNRTKSMKRVDNAKAEPNLI